MKKSTLLIVSAISLVLAFGAGAYYFARSAGEFYAVAILFGMAYGASFVTYRLTLLFA